MGWEFDPLYQSEAPYLPVGLRITDYESEEVGYYLVQFQGPILPEWKESVSKTGATLFDYLPDFTFIARMTPAVRNQVAVLPMVRWVGVYQPAYRVEPLLLARVQGRLEMLENPRDLRLSIFPGEDLRMIQQQVKALGGTVVEISENSLGTILRLQIDPQTTEQLASINGVRWVDMLPEWQLYNDKATDVMNVRSVWNNHGLYGQGQVVGVCDTGLDRGSILPANLHDDFENGSGASRVLQIIDRVGDGGNDVNSGHGTHVCGSVLGNGARSGSTPSSHTYPNTSYVGMAPEAQLVMQAVENNSTGGLEGLPSDLNTLFQQSYNAGAHIHTNSWGSAEAGQYSIDSQNVDLFSWNNPTFTILFAAGNDGVDVNTSNGVVDLSSIGSPGTAKNCITVGATENNRPSPFNSGSWGTYWPNDFPNDPIRNDPTANNPVGMAAFSSRGPTSDGRYKPDISAPGTYVASTKSSAMSGACGWGDINTNYCYMGGTSMATPLTAGATALVREFFTDQGLTPSSALLKATLVNGATELYPGQYGTDGTREQPTYRPNNVQGWGRVNLENTLFPVSPRMLDTFDFTEGLQTNEYDTFRFNLSDTSESLRSTLAWTDYPGTPAAGGGLVNDLDLEVTAPNATIYYPTNAQKRSSTMMGMYDTDPAYSVSTRSSRQYAVRFTPTAYPVNLERAVFFAYSVTTLGSADYPINYTLRVYSESGGLPESVIYGPVTVRATTMGWIAVSINLTINSGSFYISLQPNTDRGSRLTEDAAAGGERSWYNAGSWALWPGRDFNIRAVMSRPDASTNYDRVNNLVGVDLDTPPQTGNYTVTVTGYNVAHGPQPYALVNSGAIAFIGATSYRLFAGGDTAARTFGRTGVKMDFASGPAGNVTINMSKDYSSHSPTGSAVFMKVNWDISTSMETGTFEAQLVFHYDDADLPTGMTEVEIEGAYRYDGVQWVGPQGTVDTVANTVTVSNVSAFSNWTLGHGNPTAITLSRFEATPVDNAILLEWETAQELNNAGFNLYRSESFDGPWAQLNTTLIPPQYPGSVLGGVYEWLDTLVRPGNVYYYRLEDIDIYGVRTFHGPVWANADINRHYLYLPLVLRP